jgi:hypothetical protein
MTTFGDGQSPEALTYHTLANHVRALTPRELTGDMIDDVITMIDYLRTEALRVHDHNEKRAAELDAREKLLNKRTREVSNASRIAKAVINGQPRRLFNFGR